MDLYTRIGVLLVLLSGLLLFLLVFVSPIEPTVKQVESANAELRHEAEQARTAYLNSLMNRVDVKGTEVWELLENAKKEQLAVLVATLPQQGLVVNYGYQLRGANYKSNFLAHYSSAENLATEFEKMYVTIVRQIFTPGVTSAVQGEHIDRKDAHYDPDFIEQVMTRDKLNYYPGRTGTLAVSDGVPHVYASDPNLTSVASHERMQGFTYDGYLVTDQLLKMQSTFNDNFSYAKTSTSFYYISPGSRYLTSLVKDGSGQVIAIYVEEKGLDEGVNPLARLFEQAGISN